MLRTLKFFWALKQQFGNFWFGTYSKSVEQGEYHNYIEQVLQEGGNVPGLVAFDKHNHPSSIAGEQCE